MLAYVVEIPMNTHRSKWCEVLRSGVQTVAIIMLWEGLTQLPQVRVVVRQQA